MTRDKNFEEELLKKFGEVREIGYDEYVRASEIYEICPREEVIVYLNKLKRTREVGMRLGLVFFIGSVMHEALRNELLGKLDGYRLLGKWECNLCKRLHGSEQNPLPKPQKCEKCQSEEFNYIELGYVDEDLRLRGEIDGIIEDPSGTKHLLEIKVVSGSFFKYLLGSFSMRYYYQIQTYFYLTGLDSCKVLLVNKESENDSDMVAVLDIKKDDAVIEEILNKARMIVGGIKMKMYPVGVCTSPTDKRAQTCPVADICFFKTVQK